MSNLVPEGIYQGHAVRAELRASMTSTTEWIEVEFEASVAAEGEDERIEALVWRGFLTPKAERKTLESMRLCGWTGDDIRTLMDDGLGNNKVDLTVQHEEYKGKTTARVAFVNKLGAGGGLDDARVKSIAERIKAKAKNIPVPDDSDVPF